MAEKEPIPSPLCVFCSAPWTDDMMQVYAKADVEEGYYGGGASLDVEMVVDVKCSSCGRVVYRKEIRGPMNQYGDLTRVG